MPVYLSYKFVVTSTMHALLFTVRQAYNSLKHQQQDSSSAFDSGIPTSYPPVHSTSALHTRNTIPSSAVAASPTGFMPSEVQCQEHADGFMKRGTTAARGEGKKILL